MTNPNPSWWALVPTEPVDTSSSELRTWERCTGKWFIKYVLRLRPRTTKETLAFGGIFHEAFAMYYEPTTDPAHRTRDLLFGLLEDAYKEALTLNVTDETGALRARLHKVMAKYWESYGGRDWELADTEMEFRVPIFLNDRLVGYNHGRWDGLLIRDDQVWIVDHKTTKRFSWKHLLQDPQMDMYSLAGLKLFGRRFAGVMLNYVRSRVSAKSANVARVKVRRSLSQLTFIEENIGRAMLNMGAANPDVLWFTYSKSCPWDCDYRSLCDAMREGIPVAAMLESGYEPRRRWEETLYD